MRGPGEVLLVSGYELGHQPLSLASPLGFFHRAGFDADALDVAIEGFDRDKVARARLVAIAVPMHTALRIGVRVAERVREVNPAARIAFFGLYAVLNQDRLLARHADHVLGGETEATLVALAESLARGAGSGVADGTVPGVASPGRPALPVLERLAFAVPRRERLPALERYAPFLDRAGRPHVAGYIEASRGCLHLCRHCPIVPVYGGRFFVVPEEVVLADARQQVAAGARHLTFGDPDFLNAPTHSLRLARTLHAEFPDVTFDVTAKVEHLIRHQAILPELAALGCAFVVSALESLSDPVLVALDKGHTRDDIDRALDALDAAGLPLRPSFVPFTPWTNLADYVELLEWIERRGMIESVDPIQLAIRLLVPPGSRLLELPAGPGWPGPLDAEAFTHRWRHEDPRMDALQAEVSVRLEHAARHGEEPRLTFTAVRALARAAAGAPPVAHDPLLGPRRDRPPRLAEAWFC